MKLKLQYFGHQSRRADSLEEIPLRKEDKTEGGRRRGDRGGDGWMA